MRHKIVLIRTQFRNLRVQVALLVKFACRNFVNLDHPFQTVEYILGELPYANQASVMTRARLNIIIIACYIPAKF